MVRAITMALTITPARITTTARVTTTHPVITGVRLDTSTTTILVGATVTGGIVIGGTTKIQRRVCLSEGPGQQSPGLGFDRGIGRICSRRASPTVIVIRGASGKSERFRPLSAAAMK